MMEKSNINWYAMGDQAILQAIGDYIQQTRLEQNKTQQQLATAASINRSTLVQIEKGRGGTLTTLIEILRALQQLQIFKNFEYKQQISPLELAKLEQNKRQRSRNKKDSNAQKSKSTW